MESRVVKEGSQQLAVSAEPAELAARCHRK